MLHASAKREFLESIAELLKLKKGDKDWYTFFDLATLSQQKVSDDVYEDEDVVSALRVFIRTVSGERPTGENSII